MHMESILVLHSRQDIMIAGRRLQGGEGVQVHGRTTSEPHRATHAFIQRKRGVTRELIAAMRFWWIVERVKGGGRGDIAFSLRVPLAVLAL